MSTTAWNKEARQWRKSMGTGDVVREKKKHKPSAMKKAVAYADSWFRQYIKLRDPRCVTCGEPTTDCSHIFKGRHHNTRWAEECAYGQCRKCHMVHHLHSEYQLQDFWKRKIGEEKAEYYYGRNFHASARKAADIGKTGDDYRDLCKEMK